MPSLGQALTVVLAILIIVGCYRLIKWTRALKSAVAEWGQPIDPACDDPTAVPASCDPILVGPLGLPPPAEGRPSGVPPPFDAPRATYAVKLVTRFIAYLGTKNAELVALQNMAPPVLSYMPSDRKMALASTWVSADGTSAVVAIRGTKTVKDFLLDMQYRGVSFAGGVVSSASDAPTKHQQTILIRPPTAILGAAKAIHVHRGMYSAYMSIRDSLFAALPASIASSGGEVFIAGHSMGAAVAFYYALELAVTYPKIAVSVIGLAPPRAGNSEFTKDLAASANCTSVINFADFVPSMPWSYMPDASPPFVPDEYAHVAPMFAFSNRKSDIASCHGPLAYFEGITGSNPPAFVPSI